MKVSILSLFLLANICQASACELSGEFEALSDRSYIRFPYKASYKEQCRFSNEMVSNYIIENIENHKDKKLKEIHFYPQILEWHDEELEKYIKENDLNINGNLTDRHKLYLSFISSPAIRINLKSTFAIEDMILTQFSCEKIGKMNNRLFPNGGCWFIFK